MGSIAQPQAYGGRHLVAKSPKEEWNELCARHSPRLYRRVLRIVRNPEDAEDALQDGLLLAFRNLHHFEGRSGLSTWLTRIVINAALMQLRGRRKYEAASLDKPLDETGMTAAERIIDPGPSPEQICALSELRHTLAHSIGGLSAEMRTAVSLRYLQGLSSQEAARTCGVSENTLKARLRRARLRLARSKPSLEQWREWSQTSGC